MSRNSESVKRWRRGAKGRIVLSLGSKCVCCGYNKCNDALIPHHVDPSKKEFSLGGVRSNSISWSRIVEELRKCVLVCGNCHAEIHAGVRVVPSDAVRFNERMVQYKEERKTSTCPVCGGPKLDGMITCSKSCAARNRYKVDWSKVDLRLMLENSTIIEVADKLGVSDMTIRKRLKKTS